jgi:hypothetical protein
MPMPELTLIAALWEALKALGLAMVTFLWFYWRSLSTNLQALEAAHKQLETKLTEGYVTNKRLEDVFSDIRTELRYIRDRVDSISK